MRALWSKFRRWLLREKPVCEHEWRPCIVSLHTWGGEKRPARQCLWCKQWQPLTEAQFYAEFGEGFFAMVAREVARDGP